MTPTSATHPLPKPISSAALSVRQSHLRGAIQVVSLITPHLRPEIHALTMNQGDVNLHFEALLNELKQLEPPMLDLIRSKQFNLTRQLGQTSTQMPYVELAAVLLKSDPTLH